MPRKGLQFPQQLPFAKWVGIGKQLSAVGTSSAWCLGDWLVYGEVTYSSRYRDAIEQTSLEYQTLRNYAWVSRRFALSRRRDTLSFGHHAEVASLPEPEQDFWLRKAEDFSWSRNRLRREVRASLKERSSSGEPVRGEASPETRGGDPPEDGYPASAESEGATFRIQIQLTPEQLEICRAAADRVGCSIEDWVVLTLDQATREDLEPA